MTPFAQSLLLGVIVSALIMTTAVNGQEECTYSDFRPYGSRLCKTNQYCKKFVGNDFCAYVCEDDSECTRGSSCINNVCNYGCNATVPCSDKGFICNKDGACVKDCDYMRADCPTNYQCVGEFKNAGCETFSPCENPGYKCTLICKDDSECSKNGVCRMGLCRKHCKDDTSCPKDFKCQNGDCVKGCEKAEDCAGSEYPYCVKQRCSKTCDDEDENSCPKNFFCQDDKCILVCNDTSCPTNFFCENKQCVQRCLTSENCADNDNRYCVDNVCQSDCRGDTSCPKDFKCQDNVCKKSCQTVEDCAGSGRPYCTKKVCEKRCDSKDDHACPKDFYCNGYTCIQRCETADTCHPKHPSCINNFCKNSKM